MRTFRLYAWDCTGDERDVRSLANVIEVENDDEAAARRILRRVNRASGTYGPGFDIEIQELES